MAEQVETKAEKAESAGHKVSVREFYLRAANYYRTAMMSMYPLGSRITATTEKTRSCMKKANQLFDPVIESICKSDAARVY